MKKLSIHSLPATVAMAAALMFGAQAYAQTTSPATPIPGSTSPKNATDPAPMGGASTRSPGMGMGMSGSGNQVSNSATMTPGTTNPKNDVMPAPTAGSQTMKTKRVAKRAKRKPVASSMSNDNNGQPDLNQPGTDAPRR